MAPRPLLRSTPRVAVAFASAVGLAGSTVVACSLALNFNGIDDGVRDGAPSAADGSIALDAQSDGALPFADASTDAPAATDGPVTLPDAGDAALLADGGCPPSAAGPALVPAKGFCIDSTEVTVTQYTAFLTALGGTVPTQPAVCSPWNNSLAPFGGLPVDAGNLPVSNVNWCQAYLYCQWAGKRLCGSPAGGSANANEWNVASESEWYEACSEGFQSYPYGNAYEPTACNGADYDAGGPVPSLASCVGSFPSLFDMSGNVFEWEDACQGPDGGALTGANDYCNTRGGAYTTGSATLRCDDGTAYSRQSQAPFVGFRCCSP